VVQAFVKVFPDTCCHSWTSFSGAFFLGTFFSSDRTGQILGGSSLLPEVSIRPLTRRFRLHQTGLATGKVTGKAGRRGKQRIRKCFPCFFTRTGRGEGRTRESGQLGSG